jgi:hypothetical protein
MTAVLADATNLGLARMARSSGVFSHSKLLWTADAAMVRNRARAVSSAGSKTAAASRLSYDRSISTMRRATRAV